MHTHRQIYGKPNVFNQTNNNYYPYFDLESNILNLFLGVHKHPICIVSIFTDFYMFLVL